MLAITIFSINLNIFILVIIDFFFISEMKAYADQNIRYCRLRRLSSWGGDGFNRVFRCFFGEEI